MGLVSSESPSLVRVRPLTGLLSLWHSTIGKKYVMALSGLILWGYLVLHLWGNLKIFLGRDAINQWGVFLRVFGDPVFSSQQVLWAFRLVLLAALILHVVAAYQLSARDFRGRPVAYAVRKNLESTFASRTMRWGGVAILLFVIYHILHLTTGTVHSSFEEGDIYHNLVSGFQVWWVSLIYVVAMVAVGLHLYHGIWSMFQTLGWNSARSNRLWRNFGTFFAVALTLGNVSIPIAVLAGFVR